MWIYDQPRTISICELDAGTGRKQIQPAKPDQDSYYDIYSVIHDEPPLELDAAGAVGYMVDQHGWDRLVVETLLAQLRVGDEMRPDETQRFGNAEERLVRVK